MSFISDLDFELHVGDALRVLRSFTDDSIDCCVTSPPYFNLRDYGIAGQIGLEDSPSEYIDALVEVFEEVRRVLVPQGTLWLNLGDSYAAKARGSDKGWDKSRLTNPGGSQKRQAGSLRKMPGRHRGKAEGLKEKDLIGIPWMAAFALREAGWWLRSDVIWSKPNAMPESIEDRPTKAHEYLFLLTKSKTYYYDQKATLEQYGSKAAGNSERKYGEDVGAPGLHRGNAGRGIPWTPHIEPDPNVLTLDGLLPEKPRGPDGRRMTTRSTGEGSHENHRTARDVRRERWPAEGRNMRSVWEIPTTPFGGQHFATFPLELARRCVLTGCPEGGVVLDPFMGAGTTALAARGSGRRAIGVELNPDYAEMCAERLSQQTLLAVEP